MKIPIRRSRRNLGMGLLAGAAGGFIASLAMSQFHSLVRKPETPPQDNKEDSTVLVASKISETLFHHELTPRQKDLAGQAVHYGFGTAMGAIYGTAVEVLPRFRTGYGAALGIAVWLGAHVIAVPALGLSDPVTASSPRSEAVEFAAHLLYGAVADAVRKLIAGIGR